MSPFTGVPSRPQCSAARAWRQGARPGRDPAAGPPGGQLTALTALITSPRVRYAPICRAIITETFTWASAVVAPRCGRGDHLRVPRQRPVRGRLLVEDVHARAAHLPRVEGGDEVLLDDDAAAGAVHHEARPSSSSRTPSRRAGPSSRRSSARARRGSPPRRAPRPASRAARRARRPSRASRTGSKATTVMPRPRAMRATAPPTLPMPTSPSVLPSSSEPEKLFLSQVPAFIEASARGISRARANIRPTASSAAASALPPGVFEHEDPPLGGGRHVDVVDARRPARPITFSAFPASITCAARLRGRAHHEADRVAEGGRELRGRQARLHHQLQLGELRRTPRSPSFAIESATNTFIFAMQGVYRSVHIYASELPTGCAPRARSGYSRLMTDVTVISLGGSLIAPEAVDTAFLASFHRLAVGTSTPTGPEADRDLRRRRPRPALPGRLPRARPSALERRPRLGRHRGHPRERRAGAPHVRRPVRRAPSSPTRPPCAGSPGGSWWPRAGSRASRPTTTRSSWPGGSARGRWSTCRTSRRSTPPTRRRIRRRGRWTRCRGRSSAGSSARSGPRAGTPRSIPRRPGPPPPRV